MDPLEDAADQDSLPFVSSADQKNAAHHHGQRERHATSVFPMAFANDRWRGFSSPPLPISGVRLAGWLGDGKGGHGMQAELGQALPPPPLFLAPRGGLAFFPRCGWNTRLIHAVRPDATAAAAASRRSLPCFLAHQPRGKKSIGAESPFLQMPTPSSNCNGIYDRAARVPSHNQRTYIHKRVLTQRLLFICFSFLLPAAVAFLLPRQWSCRPTTRALLTADER